MVCLTSTGTSPVVLPPKESDDISSSPLLADLSSASFPASFNGGASCSGDIFAAAPLSLLSSPRSLDCASDRLNNTGFFVPQLLQKASPGTVAVPHSRHSAIVKL